MRFVVAAGEHGEAHRGEPERAAGGVGAASTSSTTVVRPWRSTRPRASTSPVDRAGREVQREVGGRDPVGTGRDRGEPAAHHVDEDRERAGARRARRVADLRG